VTKLRRTPYACFYLQDDQTLDLEALLSGEVPQPNREAEILALAVLTGARQPLSRGEFALLASVPADRWIDHNGEAAGMIESLTEKGLLLSDEDDRPLAALRARDDALSENQWNLYAALYHYMTQWSGVELPEGSEEPGQLKAQAIAAATEFLAEHGPPPGAFAEARSAAETPLPGRAREGQLYQTLRRRRTTRAFDPDEPMTLDELDAVLRYVFGCHGEGLNSAGVTCIKRTSPSGGALHPVEAYPLISNVEGVAPGLYQYNVRNHSLIMLCEVTAAEARDMATTFMCGQRYFGDAHVAFILSARFDRNHWKYRRHQKAYAGMLMDAAHLSQTLYLVSTDLGLGAFVTLAINSRDIEDRLGLDGISEGVIAMTGCGRRTRGGSPLEMQFSEELPES
jgi:putative peptide maturation dehydrogenase